jgi:NitT/TauT family transport system permease protein
MNAVVTEAKIAAAGGGLYNTLAISWNHERPVIPAPHQIIAELWNSVFMVAPWKVKSLVYHSWITLSSTLVGFLLGALLGIGLAIAIVHSKFLSKSLMPWIVASQTIPILAIAPMVIVVLGAIGLTGLVPKSLISMYLCFFPVTIGMVKGLTSPEIMQLDLMRTYNASQSQVLWKLRFPASLPFLFASLKVAVAIALTGAIVGELPTGAIAGIGARLLNGSYYGQTVQIWAALFAASFVAAALVWCVGAVEKITGRLMGARP